MTRTVAFHTLGCKVNQVDTQGMASLFVQSGYEIVGFDGVADTYVINTCTVTNTGDKKSRQAIRHALTHNPDAIVAVTGCYAQIEPQACAIPGVHVVLGNQYRDRIVMLCEQQTPIIMVDDLTQAKYEELPIGATEKTRAFLKIQEGCRQFCSFCIIPYARGPLRSRHLASIVEEARQRLAQGFHEIVLTGINLSAYHDEGNDLADVVLALDEMAVQHNSRIRLGSLEPHTLTDTFIDKLSMAKSLCRQFHVPLQSGCDETLQAMNRRYTTAAYAQIIGRMRRQWPGAAITTDVMVGFPGETEAQFEQSLSFCRSIGFAQMHVFPCSKREGTAAAKLPQLSRSVKQQRARMMGQAAQEMAQTYMLGLVGETDTVLVEEPYKDGMIGYNDRYVQVLVPQGQPGELLRVRLDGVEDTYMTGSVT